MITHKTRWKPSSAQSLLEKQHSKLPKVQKYCLDVLSGALPAGRLAFLAVERHLGDLERTEGKETPLRWDEGDALRAIEFFEAFLCLAEGEHDGQPFKLNLGNSSSLPACLGGKS